MTEEKNSFFDSMQPKAGFTFGVVTGVAAVTLLVLLYAVSGGTALNGKTAAKGGSGTNPIAAAPSPAPAPTPLPPAGDPPPVTSEDHVRGDIDAPLTLIEYSDYECPFCKRFHPTMEQMMVEYGNSGQIKWVYRHFPLSFHDPLATAEAMATECANELGGNDKFWELTDLIFERTASNGNGLNIADLPKMGAEIGLSESEMKTCIDSGKYQDHIQSEMAAGSAAGVTGTPGSFLIDADGNAQLISGAVPYAQIKAAIEAAL